MVKNNPVATAIAVVEMMRDGYLKEIEDLFAHSCELWYRLRHLRLLG